MHQRYSYSAKCESRKLSWYWSVRKRVKLTKLPDHASLLHQATIKLSLSRRKVSFFWSYLLSPTNLSSISQNRDWKLTYDSNKLFYFSFLTVSLCLASTFKTWIRKTSILYMFLQFAYCEFLWSFRFSNDFLQDGKHDPSDRWKESFLFSSTQSEQKSRRVIQWLKTSTATHLPKSTVMRLLAVGSVTERIVFPRIKMVQEGSFMFITRFNKVWKNLDVCFVDHCTFLPRKNSSRRHLHSYYARIKFHV